MSSIRHTSSAPVPISACIGNNKEKDYAFMKLRHTHTHTKKNVLLSSNNDMMPESFPKT